MWVIFLMGIFKFGGVISGLINPHNVFILISVNSCAKDT